MEFDPFIALVQCGQKLGPLGISQVGLFHNDLGKVNTNMYAKINSF